MRIKGWLLVGMLGLAGVTQAVAETVNPLARKGVRKLSDKIYEAASCKRLAAPNGTEIVQWTCLRGRIQAAVTQAWLSFTQDSGSFLSSIGSSFGAAGWLVSRDYPGLGLDDVRSVQRSISDIQGCPADIGKGSAAYRDAACVDAAVGKAADHLWNVLAKLELGPPDSPPLPGCEGPIAVDGQSLWCQDEETIQLFVRGWKEDAAERWAWEHSRDLDVRQAAWRAGTYGPEWSAN